ncbi:SDR family NAD(P)-dependent oxidoreductase [Phyllobacterium sp. SB3]|uniref:SDR family NAD(P)-dependent oxidoreductase n=1 Tax=Phyllobacterium sp. SB3 TaxID=3156073 RepID=UPI0032AFE0F3
MLGFKVDYFKDKLAVVTGAASGIGKAVAIRLAERGCRLVVVDRDASGLDILAGELASPPIMSLIVDIASEKAVKDAVRRVAASGAIDFLVNSAGIDHLDRITECSYADWRRILSVNLDGTFLMCRSVGQHMIGQRSGSIVNVASWLAKAGMAGHGPYAASKFGMIGLTQSFAKEVAEFGIRVNAVCPGAIDHTQMRAEADRQSVERGLAPARERVKFIPLGRMGEPDDVAGVITFLLSNEARYMTGQAINVTGGLWMN